MALVLTASDRTHTAHTHTHTHCHLFCRCCAAAAARAEMAPSVFRSSTVTVASTALIFAPQNNPLASSSSSPVLCCLHSITLGGRGDPIKPALARVAFACRISLPAESNALGRLLLEALAEVTPLVDTHILAGANKTCRIVSKSVYHPGPLLCKTSSHTHKPLAAAAVHLRSHLLWPALVLTPCLQQHACLLNEALNPSSPSSVAQPSSLPLLLLLLLLLSDHGIGPSASRSFCPCHTRRTLLHMLQHVRASPEAPRATHRKEKDTEFAVIDSRTHPDHPSTALVPARHYVSHTSDRRRKQQQQPPPASRAVVREKSRTLSAESESLSAHIPTENLDLATFTLLS
ncbi:uncharacterized protein K460DRAFT_91367 [Cucurbitaria berberidis CBS 394.84]|uniref:Uncharacterized protein n=1 Tax=Cucurbitaria berberidis CBS 394.84 TaxID=1168544 RepID=A0A9P4GQG6_9PLEO|nr:uncharacterized protein K460DRAFT_91367 [Cucurbitaria berberidis CBS 394.84]KAF1849462.1 hypothetical protein K460DRAFT_91367 [Cucurbitaria berberidis CBS 394.84]